MKTSLKIAVAVATSLVGVGAAHASSIVPNTGDGSLMFFVTDTKTNQTYTDVLTQDVNSYFSAAQATSPAPTNGVLNTINGDANFQISLAGDSTLTSFLSTAGSDPLSWGVIAGAYSGSLGAHQRPVGNARFIATSGNLASVLAASESQLTNPVPSGINADVAMLNTNLGGANSTNQGVFGTASSAGGTTLNLYGSGVGMDSVLIGQTVGLYGITGNGSASGAGDAYSLGTISFTANDMLTFTGNSIQTPIPAAVWLFGSGLLGLLGVSRRRLTEAA